MYQGETFPKKRDTQPVPGSRLVQASERKYHPSGKSGFFQGYALYSVLENNGIINSKTLPLPERPAVEADSIDTSLRRNVVAAFLLAAGSLLGTIPLSSLIFITQQRAANAGYTSVVDAFQNGFQWPILVLIACFIAVALLYFAQLKNAWQTHLQIDVNSNQKMTKISVFILCALGCIGPVLVFYLMSILLRP